MNTVGGPTFFLSRIFFSGAMGCDYLRFNFRQDSYTYCKNIDELIPLIIFHELIPFNQLAHKP